MTSFRMLTLPADRESWSSWIHRLSPNKRDIHFLPEYSQIYQKVFHQKTFLAFYGTEDTFVIQPFMSRPLEGLVFLKKVRTFQTYSDITNPYGYGGPVMRVKTWQEAERLMLRFRDNMEKYCTTHKIVCEFSSLHPLVVDSQLIRPRVLHTKKTKKVIVMDLSQSEKNIWHSIRKGHRYEIQKAKKLGVVFRKVKNAIAERMFYRLYRQTMLRREADLRWHLPLSYFRACSQLLGENRVSYFFAYIKDTPIAGCMILHDFGKAYYHFSGRDVSYQSYYPGHLLLYEVALWCKEHGYNLFHLGGGVTNKTNDSLMVFKEGFSKNVMYLYTYFVVHDDVVYQKLNAMKSKLEWQLKKRVAESSFLPYYRRT